MTGAKAHYQGHRARLRERLLQDSTQLADYEILELVLGLAQTRRDTKPLAKELLQRFGSIRGVMDAHPEELVSVPGFSTGTLALWRLLRETAARYAESPARTRELLLHPEQVAAMARVRLAGCQHEEIWAALVDAGSRLIAWIRLEEGTARGSVLHIRKLLEISVRYKASGIILVHNHPSGSLKPSGPDVESTRKLLRAARELGIELLDHFVLAENAWMSFKAQGLME